MKTLLLFLTAFALLVPGQVHAQGKTLTWELRDERFAGLSLEFPAALATPGSGGLQTPFTLRVKNNRAEPVVLRRLDLKLQATSLGGGPKEGGLLSAKGTKLAPGESVELSGYFTIAPVGSQELVASLSSGAGAAAAAKETIRYQRLHGDALAGLVVTLGLSAKQEFSFYLVKYHFGEKTGGITTYSALGQ